MTDPQTPERDFSSEATAPEMILSQDELVVDAELVETGRVRLIKRVEVETVTRTIELRREVLEIQQLDAAGDQDPQAGREGEEPTEMIQSGAFAAGSLQEGVLEIVLMQEEALISTRAVPRERVRLRKRVVTEDRAIEADLRVERADLEERRMDAEPGEADLNPREADLDPRQ